MIYGYARCSTNETKQDIERQTRILKDNGADVIIYEYEHGSAAVKKEQRRMMELVQPGDTIITLEVSRLTRSTQQLCELIDEIREKHLRLVIVNSITIDCRSGEIDPMSAAFLQIAGVFAELERGMIRERTRSGMANARAKGKRIGRPTSDVDSVPESFYRPYRMYVKGEINKQELARLTKLSRPTVNKYIRLIEET